MINEELLQKTASGLYFLGPASMKFAYKAVDSISTKATIAPIIDKLAEKSKQSTAYFEWDDNCIRIVCKKDWPGSMFYRHEGAKLDFVTTHPAAITILAYSDKTLIESVKALHQLSDEDALTFTQRLDSVRRRGYFSGCFPGDKYSRVVCPVIVEGKLRGALALSAQNKVFEEEHIAEFREQIDAAIKEIESTFIAQK
jgi:DNA-binding IclR family transcriptional regulator